ncbi:MAG: ion transporter [Oligoflexales bacterium]
MPKLLIKVAQSQTFERLVILAVFLNSLLLGVEVSLPPFSEWFYICRVLDRCFLAFFTTEIITKIAVYRHTYLKDSWRVFDLLVVMLALIPNIGPLSVLRALRILRALRVISVIPRLRQVVSGLLASLPGLGAVGGILFLIFYISAVMATALFGKTHFEWFGTIFKSSYTLFQIMTLESWSMGIVRPIMEQYQWATLFFVPFIVVTTFIVLNLMIAVIVNSMQVETSEAAEEHAQQGQDERAVLLAEMRYMQSQLRSLEKAIRQQDNSVLASLPKSNELAHPQ